MIKSKLKLVEIPDTDPGAVVAAAILEAAKRTELSNRALIEAIKTILIPPPEVSVVHHETKTTIPSEPTRPRSYIFTVQRDAHGLMTHITAKAE